MGFTFYDIFRIITVFLFLFFAVFLLTFKKGNSLSNKLFAIFLFSKALCFFNGLVFRFKETFMAISPHLFYIGESFEFLLGPSIYLYAKSLAYQHFKLKKTDGFHLIPFLIHFSFLSSKYHLFRANTKIELLADYLLTYPQYIIIHTAIYLHFLIYSGATLYVLFVYQSELKNLLSNIEKAKLAWLKILVSGFIFLWGFGFIFFLMNRFGYRMIFPSEVSIVLLFVFANLIIYKGLQQPELFAGIPVKNNGQKPILDESSYHRYANQLKHVMENEKPYLIPSITLHELSSKLSISPRYLSYVINRCFEQNFFDFINSYRIKEATRILSDSTNQKKTILEVLYHVGFNSKSVFNASFKKQTGMTPTQFKKQVNNI